MFLARPPRLLPRLEDLLLVLVEFLLKQSQEGTQLLLLVLVEVERKDESGDSHALLVANGKQLPDHFLEMLVHQLVFQVLAVSQNVVVWGARGRLAADCSVDRKLLQLLLHKQYYYFWRQTSSSQIHKLCPSYEIIWALPSKPREPPPFSTPTEGGRFF